MIAVASKMIMEKKKKNRKRKSSLNTSDDKNNKKLRKIDGAGDVDNDKVPRNSENEDDDEISNQMQTEEQEIEPPLPALDGKQFNMKKFRENLRKGDCIIEIRHFLKIAADDPLIVSQFYRAGGKPLEFIQILNKIDKNELFYISYVFSGMHLLLIEKLQKSVDLTKETEAIEACAFIINNHRSSIEKLLSSNYSTHKKSVLKLLTAIVYLAPHLGRELLTTLNVVFNAESLQKFTAHDKSECHLPDEDRVRTCYIYFIMAYIIEGNHILINNLLDRNELVMAVVSGLIYDSEKTVCLVLNSLLKFVLKAESVSKTKKVQVFNLDVVKELLRLFVWKGPKYFAVQFNRKLKDKAEEYVNANELNVISDAVYDFLKELLASRKHGIAFKCLGQRRLKFNAIQKKVLLLIDNFWDHEQKKKLTIEILKACPELTKHFVQKHAARLDTFKKNNNWFQIADFFTKLIDSMSPSIMQYHLDKMNVKEITDLIKEVCMAPEILQQLRSKHSLKNSDVSIRHNSAKLLYVMFRQCDNYLFNLSKWNIYRTNDLKKIKFEVINHILVLCPTVENILLSLHMTQVDETIDSVTMFDHLECVLDLLLIITKSIPSFIDTTSSVINYIKILGPIYELNREQDNSTRIEFKAVKLLLALEPKALSPKTEMFEQVIQSFLNVYCFGSAVEKYEAKLLLRKMFLNTGIFGNGSLEIDLWLRALDQLDEAALSDVKSFLIKCIISFDVTDDRLQAKKDTSTISLGVSKNTTEMFDNIEKGRTIKGVLNVPTLNQFFHYFIEEYQKSLSEETNINDKHDDGKTDTFKNIVQYVENLSFYLFHYLPTPEAVFQAMEGIPHKYTKYMKTWIQKSKPPKLPDNFESKIFGNFYNSLIQKHSSSFLDIFQEFLLAVDEDAESAHDVLIVLEINGKKYKLTECLTNETDIMIFIYTTIFIANQLNKNNSFEMNLHQTIANHLKQFYNILNVISSQQINILKSGFEMNDSDSDCVSKALKYIFTDCFYLLKSFDIWSDQSQITMLIYELVKHVQNIDYLNEILVHYQKKICNQLETAVEETIKNDKLPIRPCQHLNNILNVFRLDFENCCVILTSLSQLPFKYFVTRENERSTYASILAYGLERLAEIKVGALQSLVFQQIIQIYINLVRLIAVEINYEIIENALFVYLSVFFQHFGDINKELLGAILEVKKLTKAGVRLAVLLLERRMDLRDEFKTLLPKYFDRKELIYPLINVIADANCEIDEEILSSLYNEFKNGISKSIEKPQKAAVIYKENVISSVFLIEKRMPLSECIDFINKSFKYESADVFQLQLIKSIHLKVLMQGKEPDIIKNAYLNFIKTFIQLFGFLLKKEHPDYDHINSFAVIAYNWIKLKENTFSETFSAHISYSSIHGSSSWLQLGKSLLRHGLKLIIEESTKKINDDAAVLIKFLAFLCNKLYDDNEQHDDPHTFFEMTTTHPKFFDIATSQRKSAIKTSLMHLIYTLVKKNPTVLDIEHIPIYLSAYQATLSHCDQYILGILQLYESNGLDLHKFKPFFWGETALSHYSLGVATKATLIQEPPMMQIMTLIDKDMCENTLVNFPIWRKLNAIDQTPEVEFEWHGILGEDHTNNITMARSNIENLIEKNATNINSDLLLTTSRRDETYENVYDPAFLIPLMQMAFAPETMTKPVRPAQNGLLAVTFAALSSSDKNMRLGAAVALQRYRDHLETARFVDSKLWFHMFDSIQNGLNSLTTEYRKTKKSRIPRVPYIAGLFFAKTINTLMNPLSEMYRPLSTFLLIKNTFNFLTVPEFNVLFQSPEVNHHAHRTFILDILRDGTKSSSDFTILLTGNIFKAILGFYGSPLSNREKNLQILTIINAAVKIPKSAKVMIDFIGINSWLSFAIDNTEFFQFDVLDTFCVIISNLYYSIQINKLDYTPASRSDIELRLLLLLLKLCPKLSSRINEIPFMRFLNILSKISASYGRSEYITESNLDHLIKCSTGYVNEQHVSDLNFVKSNAAVNQYCERKFVFVNKLRKAGLDEHKVFILSTLREIIINCSRWKYQINV